ncbi:glycosyltransferase family 39 protein [Micromonospora sp. NPDC048871]|uniref:glycosyltransferase family 39 protein n=1 Tax=unclassified Micromonospora TaxID=2617518 RepID=UPI003407988A
MIVTLAGLDAAQLWRDELATWSAATRSVPGLLRLAASIDAATVPYYLLMHFWLLVAGDTVAALRLPSALAMTAAAGLTAVLGQRLWNTRVGLLAGLLFAVLPATARYGQEARPYALATFLAVWSTLLLVDALRRPSRGRWVGYALVTAALGLTHLIAVTLIAAHAVVVLTYRTRTATPARTEPAPAGAEHPPSQAEHPPGRAEPARQGRSRAGWFAQLRPFPVALVPTVLLVAPLALRAREQRERQLNWVDTARLGDLAALPGGLAQTAAVGGLLVALAALGAGRLGRRASIPMTCLLLPVLLLFTAGLMVPLWVPRYLIFVVPFGCLLAGAALASARFRVALVVVGLAGLLGLPDHVALRRTHEWPRTATVDYQGAAQIIAAGRQDGDAVVYHPRDGWLFLDLGMRYHLRGQAPRDALLAQGQQDRGDLWATECDHPAACLAEADRVWLVVAGHSDHPLATVTGAKGEALRTAYTVQRLWSRSGLTVALLSPSD